MQTGHRASAGRWPECWRPGTAISALSGACQHPALLAPVHAAGETARHVLQDPLISYKHKPPCSMPPGSAADGKAEQASRCLTSQVPGVRCLLPVTALAWMSQKPRKAAQEPGAWRAAYALSRCSKAASCLASRTLRLTLLSTILCGSCPGTSAEPCIQAHVSRHWLWCFSAGGVLGSLPTTIHETDGVANLHGLSWLEYLSCGLSLIVRCLPQRLHHSCPPPVDASPRDFAIREECPCLQVV